MGDGFLMTFNPVGLESFGGIFYFLGMTFSKPGGGTYALLCTPIVLPPNFFPLISLIYP